MRVDGMSPLIFLQLCRGDALCSPCLRQFNEIKNREKNDSWSVINEDCKGPMFDKYWSLPATPVRAVGEHIKFNKTTETQGLQRKAMPFYEKKR